MAETTPPMMHSAGSAGASRGGPDWERDERGSGWVLFASLMLGLAGVLNIVYGIAAIDDSRFFVNETEYILSNLNTWGWVVLIVGIVQLAAAFSAYRGGTFGQWVGIAVAALSAIAALLSIPAYPLWSLAIFAIDVLIIYGLATYGGRHHRLTA